MRTNEEIENMLFQLQYPFEAHGEGLWILNDEEDAIDNIVIHHDDPLLTIRVKVMEVPEKNQQALFEALLKLNASDIIHGAYGIDEGSVVLTDTIQSPQLDLNELQASIDAISLALTTHYEQLSQYRNQ
ncbi:MAG: YbjN domain-containing protein [Myxococcales bacterium]|nr:YbjN domain-containing protein [Myxococcales bacterium]